MKQIVIVGAGFGGLQAALNLEKTFKADKNIALTLVDKRDYHLFAPSLYEAAATEEELISVGQVKKSLAVPLPTILKGKKIRFIKGALESVEAQKKQIVVNKKQIAYDYLILALGSQSDFFNIEGAEQNSMSLKSLPDALRVRNKIEFEIQSHRYDAIKKNIRLIVAGGGYTGLELAGSLKELVDYLAWKNEYPREKIEIEIIEGLNKVVAGFDDRLSADALDRLRELNINIQLSSRITKVDKNFIELMSGDKISYDVLLWTAGVKASSVNINPAVELDRKGRLPVNGFFQVKNLDNIFAIGDAAAVLGTNGQPVPSSAQDAIDQAKFLAYALSFIVKNQKPNREYKNTKHGFIVALGSHWAILDYPPFYFTGIFAYLGHLFAHFRYYVSVVGFWKGLKWVLFEAEVYTRND